MGMSDYFKKKTSKTSDTVNNANEEQERKNTKFIGISERGLIDFNYPKKDYQGGSRNGKRKGRNR